MAEPTMAGGSGGWEGTWDGAHLTEESAHAWIDGALTPESAARAESHVASCADCGALVAEARGLAAVASRVLSALDAVPTGVLPQVAPAPTPTLTPVPARRRPWWAGVPVRAAAAMLLVAGGSAAVLRSRGQKDAASASLAEEALPAVAADHAAGPSPEAASHAPPASPAAPPAPPVSAPAPLVSVPPSTVPPALRRTEVEAVERSTPKAAAPAAQEVVAPAAAPLALPAAPAPPPMAAARRREVMRDSMATTSAAVLELRAAGSGVVAGAVAGAGNGVIRGRVTDASGRPLASATVQVVGTALDATTDDSGTFVIGGVRAGAARVRARRIGYTLAETGATVARADTTEAPLVLRPQSGRLDQVVVTGASELSRGFTRATAAAATGCWAVRSTPEWQRLGAPSLPTRLRLVRGPSDVASGTVEPADGRPAAWQRGTWAAAGDTIRIELPANAGGAAALRLGRTTGGWRGPAVWTAPGTERGPVSIWMVADRCPAP